MPIGLQGSSCFAQHGQSLLHPWPKALCSQRAQCWHSCSARGCLCGPVTGPVACPIAAEDVEHVGMVMGFAASLACGITNTYLAWSTDKFLCAPRMSASYCLLFQLGKQREDVATVLSQLQWDSVLIVRSRLETYSWDGLSMSQFFKRELGLF